MGEATVKSLIEEINSTRTQASASAKDENRIMRAMLNDPTYKVDIYGKSGVEGQYCPYEESRTMIANILKDTTRITTKEAEELSQRYEFGKQESSIMVGISKEFINTYLETGRKLPLGGRSDSNIAIAKKTKEARPNNFPVKVGINDDGSDKYETKGNGTIPAHGSLKVYSSCPEWVK
jgi:hypothetical protein